MASNAVRAVVSSASSRRSRQAASDSSGSTSGNSVLNSSIVSSVGYEEFSTERRRLRIRRLRSGEEKPSKKQKSGIRSLTGRQWIVLTVLMFVTMTSSFAVCLFPPFFPRIAEEKGFTSQIYGLIIGANCLTSFFVTPFIGKYLKVIGIRFALVLGMMAGGYCCILSGFLEFFSPNNLFVIVAILIRIVHACSNAFVILATFSYTAMEFPDSVGKIFSLTRCVMNLAQLFGPMVGGAFKMVGGFYMPFVIMGTLQILFSIVSVPIMPDLKDDEKLKECSKKPNEITICQILTIPPIWISFITFVFATMCNGFLSINLEPRVIRHFHLAPPVVGTLFGLKDGANSIASLVWGFLCDRKSSVKPYIILSAALVGVSFLLIGAMRVVDHEYKLTLGIVILALTLNGIGIGGEQVSGIVDAMHEAVHAGYPDNPNMHGIIAGLWSSLSGVGRFISRAGSGVLVHHIGFDNTAAFVMFLQVFIVVMTFFYLICCQCSFKYSKSSISWEDVNYVEVENREEILPDPLLRSAIPPTLRIDIPQNNIGPIRIANSCPTRVQPEKSRRCMPIKRNRIDSIDDEEVLCRLSSSVLSDIN